jgi:heparan-alpha-glucosaminide N-acetyltransferase
MSKYPKCIGGAVGHIDRLVLGIKHMYQHPTAKKVYDSQAFDPEGVLGCLSTILQVFIGLQCGMTLVIYTCFKARVLRWLSWGCVLGLCGGLLSGFSINDGIIPVNKNLW